MRAKVVWGVPSGHDVMTAFRAVHLAYGARAHILARSAGVCLSAIAFALFLLMQTGFARADLEQAADGWLDNIANQSADEVAEELRKLEKDIPITTSARDALKGTLKSVIKRKLGENFTSGASSLAMYEILSQIRDRVNAETTRGGPCQRAAANTAWSALGIHGVLDGAADTFPEVLGGALGAGALVRELGAALADKVRRELEAWLDRYLADYRVETFARTRTVAGCSVAIRVVWNKASGKFSFAVMGDCGCQPMIFEGGQAKLAKWSVTGEGTAAWVGDETERANATEAVPRSSLRGIATVTSLSVRAVCCDQLNQPRPDPGVQPWDFRPPPRTATATPQQDGTSQPRTPTGGETQPARPLTLEEMNAKNRNATQTGQIPVIPDGPVCPEEKARLIQQAVDAKIAANNRLDMADAAFDELMGRKKDGEEVSDEALGDAQEAAELAREKARIAQDALDKAEKLETTECPEPKDQGFLPGSQLPDGEEYAYRFAVEIPEQCVATTYIVTEVRVTKTPVVPDGDNGLSTPTEALGDDSGIPECISIPISVTPPAEDVPTDPVSTPPTEDVPTPVDQPTEVSPPTVEKPPTEAPPTETPPTVELPPEEEPPTTPSTPEEPDLGLVKAESRIVELVLTSVQTGEPVGSAVVKLLEPPPALPEIGQGDPSLSDPEDFAGDVPATLVDEQGRAALTLADATPIAKDIALVEEPTQPNTAGTGQVALKREVKIDTTPYKQFTVMAKSEGFRLPQEIGAISDKICLKRKFKIANKPVLVIRVPEEQAIEFVRKVEVSEVAFVEEDPCRKKEQASDPYFDGSGLWNQEFDNQWAIKRVGYDKGRAAFTSLPQDEPVTVAVIDTGVDWYHPDLDASAFWRNPKELRANGKDDDGNGYADDLIGWNFVEGDHLPWDYDGHGTFVTGVIAASRDNEIGIAGINPSARVMVLKALDAFGRGNASMIAEAIVYAADNGARIINLSLGGRGLTQIEQMAVTHANDKGAILIVAAGNDGEDVGQYSPSGLEGVVTVAATDRNDRRAGFSNWGPAIDIAAPGIDVLSLRARNTDLLSFIQNVKYEVGKGVLGADRAYYRASGTSFAAPIVSGTLSLLLSRLPTLTSEQAIRMVLHSARDIETPGVDNYTGFGLLDADAALASDPAYFLESRLSGVKVIAGKDGNLLRVIGTAAADQFDGATLMLGRGAAPEKWLKVNKLVANQVSNGPIMDLPARFFADSQEWTIRLITKHKNGSTRESRFLLRLG